jgi:subfamily B ATP-binding cassette protein MsbA
VCRKIGVEMTSGVLKSDTHTIESKHSGKYISHFLYDVGLIANLVGTGVLNLMKDSLTPIVLVSLMFYQNWKLALFAMMMMPLAAFVAKSLGKRIGKATTESTKLNASLVLSVVAFPILFPRDLATNAASGIIIIAKRASFQF